MNNRLRNYYNIVKSMCKHMKIAEKIKFSNSVKRIDFFSNMFDNKEKCATKRKM